MIELQPARDTRNAALFMWTTIDILKRTACKLKAILSVKQKLKGNTFSEYLK